MGLWNERVVPRLTDRLLSNPQVDRLRGRVCEGLHGQVLEIGFGSGLNVSHYPAEVTSVHAVEPSDVGWSLSRRRRESSAAPILRSGLDGEHLAEDDGSFDGALATFTLCSIPDVEQALRELHRVLRPGGAFHYLEHGLAPGQRVATWQARLDPLERRVAGGCHLTRDVPTLLREAGFRVLDQEARYLGGPAFTRPWTYYFLGRAERS